VVVGSLGVAFAFLDCAKVRGVPGFLVGVWVFPKFLDVVYIKIECSGG